MSVDRSVWINCDRCGDLISDADLGAYTAREAREEARQHGARTGLPGGLDYCGDCWEQMRQEVTGER